MSQDTGCGASERCDEKGNGCFFFERGSPKGKDARTVGNIVSFPSVVRADADAEFFFRDSSFQLCVLDPETKEYFAYDDHGIFWIYSGRRAFRKLLKREGFENRREELILHGDHYHLHPQNPGERMEIFKERLVALSHFSESDDR